MELLGQVGLIPDGKGFIPNIINWATRSTVHHAIVAISDTECIGAEPNGATIRPLSFFPNAIWSRFPLSDAQAQGSAQWAAEREGRPYNWIDDAIIGIQCVSGVVFPRFITNHYDNDKYYECAQLADAALTHGAGISVFDDNRPPGLVYPGSFEKLFREYGWWTRPELVARTLVGTQAAAKL